MDWNHHRSSGLFLPAAGPSRRTVLQLLSASAFGLLAAGCSSGDGGSSKPFAPSTGTAGAPAPKSGGALTWAGNLQVQTLDPAFSTIITEECVLQAVCDTLISYDADYTLQPSLAKSWTWDGDDLVLELQESVVFHDGTPFDADAVKFNLDRLLDPATNSPVRGQIAPPLKSVKVEGKNRVRLVCEGRWRPLLAALSMRPGFMISPAAVGKYGSDVASHPVGTGAFKLDSWNPGQQIVLSRFDNYWKQQKSYLDSVTMKHVEDPSTQLSMLRTGAAQLVDQLPPRLLATVQGVQGVKLYSRNIGAWDAAQVNLDHDPFSSPEFRKSLAYATNRDAVKKAVYLDAASPADQPNPSGWSRSSYAYPYDYDMAASKKAASSALPSKTLTFTTPNRSSSVSIAEVLFEDYRKIGFDVKTATAPSESWYSSVVDGSVDWTLVRWEPWPDPDILLRMLFHSEGTQNTTKFNDPEVDRLLDEAAVVFDNDKAAPLYDQISRRIVDAAPYQFITQPHISVAMIDKLYGFTMYPSEIFKFGEMYMA